MPERGELLHGWHLWMEYPANSLPPPSISFLMSECQMGAWEAHSCKRGWAQISQQTDQTPQTPDSPPSTNAGGIEVGCRSLTSLRAPSLLRPRPSSYLCVIQTPWSSIQLCRLLFWGGGEWEGNNKHRGANGQHKSIPETDRCRGSLRSKKRIPPHPSLSVSGIRTKL